MEDPKPRPIPIAEPPLPAAWRDFIRYCREMRFGEIERLNIQDGQPVLAEVTRKKIKFGAER